MALSVSTLFLLSVSLNCIAAYEPNWDSLDTRPLPQWYDDAKIGIFIHWGVFSVPSFGDEWFWYNWLIKKESQIINFMAQHYKPDFTYPEFAKDFTAEFYEPKDWVKIFSGAGAKYIVFVSKHHEGFTNWPSNYSFNWNSMDVGPKRDLVGELANATRQYSDMKFGLYHSMMDFLHPLYLSDKASNWEKQEFPKAKTIPELYEIVNKYQPEVIWSDGDWQAPDSYWKSQDFLAWLYTNSSVKNTVVTNDRFGKGISCHHGDYYTCSDRFNPGKLQKHKWENAMTLDKRSWGYRRNTHLYEVLSIEELLQTLAKTISCGGNLLVNVGPPAHGQISPIYEERLTQMGDWLKVNGEAVYASRPWSHQNDTVTKDVWYTKKSSSSGTTVYAFIYSWPSNGTITLGAIKSAATSQASVLGDGKLLSYKTVSPQGITVTMPALSLSDLPCQWLWVIKVTNVAN